MQTLEWITALLFWLLGLFLMWKVPLVRRYERQRIDSSNNIGSPNVSVIVPARNEESNITSLLHSLDHQTLTPHEVIVVDDDSSDGTAVTARRMRAMVIAGQALPDGWCGKTWACWQGAQYSRSELLLFLDADTWLEPPGIERMVSAYLDKGGMLTVQPYHVTHKPYEQLSAFFNIVLMAGINAFTPLGSLLKPSGAFGPCLVCSRADYFRTGGHSTVRSEVLEDLAMAKVFLSRGLPLSCYGGRGTISFRMYPAGLKELIEGWSKNFGAGAFSIRLLFFMMTALWISGCFKASFALLPVLRTPFTTTAGLPFLIYGLYVLEVRWMLKRIGRFRWWTAAVFPIPLVFFALIMLRSLVLTYILR